MGFNIGSKIVKATGGSISRVGNHRIHQFPGEYVTDGLCLYVDTTHHDSLDIGSDSGHDAGTIYDLSGNGRHGTITNMPYNNLTGTTSLKHNDFGGNGSHVEFSHAETPLPNLLTTELLVRISNHPGGSSYDTLWQKGTNWNSTNSDCGLHLIYGALRYHFGDHWQGNGTTYTETNLSLGKWYHIVTSSENLQGRNSRLYVNGALVNANPCDGSAGRGPYTGPSTTSALKINYGSGGGHNGEFGLFRTYNRQLSDEEVLQNFNSIKTRIHGSYSNYNVSTFTPTCSGNKGKVEVLAVGGGGSGGNDVGGGGAGGRALYNSSFAVNSGVAIDVTVGVGATSADTAVNGHGGNGGTTQFSTLTALGGNGGYGRSGGKSYAGWNGGGSSYNSTTGVTPTGAGGEKGFKGGNTYNANTEPCGCGGGAGAGGVGGNGVNGAGGAGGNGVAYSISGTSKYYAGGGGGSYYNVTNAGGLSGSGVGGRGAGGSQSAGDYSTPGAPRTGSGGGGGFSSGSVKTGGHGSEGCVIVRYPAEDYNIELLIVAGGGAGGSASGNGSAGGGGGAGGLLYYSKVPVSSGKNYKVWVGEGGDKVSGDNFGKNGKDSFFDDKIAIGGGGGGKGHNNGATGFSEGKNGGSGGGGGSNAGTPASGLGLGGSSTTGQGFAGGGGSDGSGSDGAGGGGGASAVGGDGVGGTATAQGGDGGAGLAYSITGTSTTYAGGGGGGGALDDSNSGGGDGGAGGGGRGGHDGGAGVSGTTNTGGGGGGAGCRSGSDLNSGNGGTGIVIVAYKGPQRGTGGTVSTTARPGYTTHIFYGYPKDGSSGNAMKNSAHLFVA